MNTCNACAPAIPDTISVAASGFVDGSYPWEWYNDTMECLWDSGCAWSGLSGAQAKDVGVLWSGSEWEIWFLFSANWTVLTGGSTDPCDPRGTYTGCTSSEDGCAAGTPQAIVSY